MMDQPLRPNEQPRANMLHREATRSHKKHYMAFM